MKIDELTLGDIKRLQSMIGGVEYTTKIDGGIRIVILQRGWVMVGRYSQIGNECKLTNCYVIRRWGTSQGLGELATEGPLLDTKLEPTPETTFHILTVIASIKCEESKWASKIS